MSSERLSRVPPVGSVRRFSAQELDDDARVYSSDTPEAEKSFRELNAEKNRVWEMDMRDFQRLQTLPIPNGRARPDVYVWQEAIEVVYFVQALHGGPVKIGHTYLGKFLSRLTNLQVSHPFDLVTRRLVVGTWKVERGLHNYFREHGTRGGRKSEWFWPVPELVEISDALPLKESDHRPAQSA